MKEVPEALFVCVQNAGRSQMAAALLHHHAQGRVQVRSAGSAPASEIHRNVAHSLAEIGLDISREFPKPLTDEVVRAALRTTQSWQARAQPRLARQRVRASDWWRSKASVSFRRRSGSIASTREGAYRSPSDVAVAFGHRSSRAGDRCRTPGARE